MKKLFGLLLILFLVSSFSLGSGDVSYTEPIMPDPHSFEYAEPIMPDPHSFKYAEPIMPDPHSFDDIM